ncbi:MAG: helix-turn-helix domain-containing protein [Firmicutes bacterium]|nr:helix-turn-helix domain-containing protein [Bacillota bacterium]
MIFAETLKLKRKERGLLQKDIAQAIGVSVKTISRFELGEREPSFEVLIKIANFFETSTDYLVGKVDEFGNPKN